VENVGLAQPVDLAAMRFQSQGDCIFERRHQRADNRARSASAKASTSSLAACVRLNS
jgi:hypothetical protein